MSLSNPPANNVKYQYSNAEEQMTINEIHKELMPNASIHNYIHKYTQMLVLHNEVSKKLVKTGHLMLPYLISNNIQTSRIKRFHS